MVLFLLLGFHSCGYANHSATRILILGDSLSAAHGLLMPVLAGKQLMAACNACPDY
jgi:hypothetical protein